MTEYHKMIGIKERTLVVRTVRDSPICHTISREYQNTAVTLNILKEKIDGGERRHFILYAKTTIIQECEQTVTNNTTFIQH